jgi:hypothetical protein
MRILARQQLQQQLVQIEAAQQRRAAGSGMPATPFRLDQRLELAGAGPRSDSGWNACSSPRSSERGRLAPRATSPTRPCSRVNASTMRLVSR